MREPLGFQQQLVEEVAVVQRGVWSASELRLGRIHGGQHLASGDASLSPVGEQGHRLGGLDGVELETALLDEELAPLAGSGWDVRKLARGRYGTVITGYRRCAHFRQFTPSHFSALFFRGSRVVTGLWASHITAHFICPLNAHFISDGLIPCRQQQLENKAPLGLIRAEQACPLQPDQSPAELLLGRLSTLDALVRLDVQLLGDGLPRNAALDADDAGRVVHERPQAEHVDLARQHRQTSQGLALIVVDLETWHSAIPLRPGRASQVEKPRSRKGSRLTP